MIYYSNTNTVKVFRDVVFNESPLLQSSIKKLYLLQDSIDNFIANGASNRKAHKKKDEDIAGVKWHGCPLHGDRADGQRQGDHRQASQHACTAEYTEEQGEQCECGERLGLPRSGKRQGQAR